MYIAYQAAQSIVDEMKASLHRDINIMNEDGIIIASTNPARRGTMHQGALKIIREKLPSLIVYEDNEAEGVQKGINMPVILDGKIEGVIGITGDPNEVSIFGDIIKKMTEIMLASVYQQRQANLLERAKTLFVENWIFSTDVDWKELSFRGQLLGFDINAPYVVALLSCDPANAAAPQEDYETSEISHSHIIQLVQNSLNDSPRHFCMPIKNQTLILIHSAKSSEAFQKISNLCQSIESYYNVRSFAGVSNPTTAPIDIHRSYVEAKTALMVAEQAPLGRALLYNQSSLEFIAMSLPAPIQNDLKVIVFGSCSKEDQTVFSQTIRMYFECDGNIQTCANKLFIHRNSFQYRMDTIKRKTGYDMKKPKDLLLLYLATI